MSASDDVIVVYDSDSESESGAMPLVQPPPQPSPLAMDIATKGVAEEPVAVYDPDSESESDSDDATKPAGKRRPIIDSESESESDSDDADAKQHLSPDDHRKAVAAALSLCGMHCPKHIIESSDDEAIDLSPLKRRAKGKKRRALPIVECTSSEAEDDGSDRKAGSARKADSKGRGFKSRRVFAFKGSFNP